MFKSSKMKTRRSRRGGTALLVGLCLFGFGSLAGAGENDGGTGHYDDQSGPATGPTAGKPTSFDVKLGPCNSGTRSVTLVGGTLGGETIVKILSPQTHQNVSCSKSAKALGRLVVVATSKLTTDPITGRPITTTTYFTCSVGVIYTETGTSADPSLFGSGNGGSYGGFVPATPTFVNGSPEIRFDPGTVVPSTPVDGSGKTKVTWTGAKEAREQH